MRLRRRGQAVVIGTLIMVVASALLTSLMLYWGLSLQGQSLSNFGGALASSNAQAAEQTSIDNVLFTKVTSGCSGSYCYAATVFARNFGTSPVRLAGIHVRSLQSGISPGGADCEVTTSSSSTSHLVIVALSMTAVTLNTATGSISSTTPGCSAGPILFSSNWNGQTVSIQIATEQGTSFQKNYAIPP